MCVYEPWRPKGSFQFEIIINVLVYRRQILTSNDGPRAERVKALHYKIGIFTHLKLCPAVAIQTSSG